MRFLHSLAIAAVLAAPAATFAQQPERIRPGAMLDTTFVRPRVDSLAVLTTRGGQSVRVGTAVMETRIYPPSGERRVIYVQRLLMDGEPPVVADSLIAHWGTLLPVRAHTRGDDPRSFYFAADSVIMIIPLGSDPHREVELDALVFYRATDLLLRGLPLRPGYRAILPVLGQEYEAGELHVAVTGEDRARTLDGGACPSLVVQVREGSFAGTFRLSTADRSVIRFDSPQATLVRPTGCP